jgi:alcohol dehydrogenase
MGDVKLPAGAMNSILRLPRQVLFGRGVTSVVGDALRDMGRSVFLCTDANVEASGIASPVVDSLLASGFAVRTFAGAVAELPLSCVEACMREARRGPVDVVIGLGGGSSIDLAKVTAILLSYDGPIDRFYGENMVPGPVAPIVAIPTTAGTGSEVTPVAVVADPSRALKVGISDPRIIPTIAICDPELTLSCPPAVTGFSGVDALVHAVESFCAPRMVNDWSPYPGNVFRGHNELSRGYSLVAIERIERSLERAYADGGDLAARIDLAFASLCAGISFAHAGTATAHALQYPVGAATNTPHGLGVGLLLPYTLENARPDVDADLLDIAKALGLTGNGDLAGAAVDEIERLIHAVGVPTSLKEIGVQPGSLATFASEAMGISRLIRNAPRQMSELRCLRVLEAAWSGDRSLAGVGGE